MKRILSLLAIAATVVTVGLAGSTSANAYFIDSPRVAAPKAAVAEFHRTVTLSTTVRKLCVKSGTGAFANLWVDAATGLCPQYSETDRWWTPTTLEEAFGPIGHIPAVPDSGLFFGHATAYLTTASHDVIVTVSGAPAYSTLVAGKTLVSQDSGDIPAAIGSASVTPITPAAGATDRSYHVVGTGFAAAGATADVHIDVIVAK